VVPQSDGVEADTDAILLAIESAHRAIAAIAGAALRERAPGLSIGEFAVLRSLSRNELRRVTDLGVVLAMAPSTLTRYCDHLASMGLITRQREARDRREIGIRITPAGRSMVKKVVTDQRRALATRLEGLSENERRQLVRLSDKLALIAQGDQGQSQRSSA
jgi:DNA-binding MarR family transcriptional regulator